MQFWRSDTQKFVALHLGARNLTCICLTGKYPDVQIVEQQVFELNSKIVHELVLYNPTVFKNYIVNFSKKHNLDMAQWGLILAGPIIIENFNSINHQLIEHKFSKININGRSGAPADDWFYTAHIPAGISWQYQLVFIQQRLNLMGVTSQNGALLGLLKFSDFELTANLQNLVSFKKSELSLGINLNLTDLNLAEQQVLLACLGLYVSWGA